MIELFTNVLTSISDDYLAGKSIETKIKRILNIVLNCCIVSFIYIKFYGPFQWFDYNNYKAILNFILDGTFFIPVAIYYVVDKFFYYLSRIALFFFQKTISAYLIRKVSIINSVTDFDADKALFGKIISVFQSKITNEDRENFIKNKRRLKERIDFNFEFKIKSIISLFLFYFSNSSFGWLLFTILLITLILAIFLIVFVSLIVDLIPQLISKFSQSAE